MYFDSSPHEKFCMGCFCGYFIWIMLAGQALKLFCEMLPFLGINPVKNTGLVAHTRNVHVH